MLRIIFASIIVLHGMFHMVGLSSVWHSGTHVTTRMMNASGLPSRFTGATWLFAGALFVIAGICCLLRREWYWIPGAAALVISQTLVILSWNDARYATIVNILFFVAFLFAAMTMRFNNNTRREVKTLLMNSKRDEITVTEEMTSRLPVNVQLWLRRSGVIGKCLPATYRIEQEGMMRTKPDGAWMPFTATQYFSIDPPGFVWSAAIKAAALVTIAGRDTYQNGHGNMVISPMYIFNAANSSGEQVDQGTLVRYMAEMAWFPQAAVSEYLKWESISEQKARVTMNYGGVSATGVYRFDHEGSVAGFYAERYGDFGGVYKKETWSVVTKEYRSIGGLYTGSVSEVTWKLKEGDFHWLTLEVTGIEPGLARH